MVKRTYPRCPRDGWPMVQIGGRWECAAEYLLTCLEQQPVAEVVLRGKTTWYVFEDGHRLPLLCFCCDSPLVLDEPEAVRQDMLGRRLVDVGVAIARLEDGTRMPQIHLLFAPLSSAEEGILDIMSVQVAARLRHPPGCPNRVVEPAPATGPQRQKRQRKRR
ncbi:MAG: hypothetical protein KKA73_07650 [Chloroflexi bacterium]|nr:hypothetical protein [Chloroflexota bacterium]MBU1747546.1 hypothetical protein [Chloroflexota bacterium]